MYRYKQILSLRWNLPISASISSTTLGVSSRKWHQVIVMLFSMWHCLRWLCEGNKWYKMWDWSEVNENWRRVKDSRTFQTSTPKGTKRMQIKAYSVQDGVPYLLCAMLNDRGWPITLKHGTTSISYQNVFLSEIGAIQCVGCCDFLLFSRIKLPSGEYA